MNLRNGQITVEELLQNSQARALLTRQFPQIMGSPLLRRARSMQLHQIVALTRRYISPAVLRGTLLQLQNL